LKKDLEKGKILDEISPRHTPIKESGKQDQEPIDIFSGSLPQTSLRNQLIKEKIISNHQSFSKKVVDQSEESDSERKPKPKVPKLELNKKGMA